MQLVTESQRKNEQQLAPNGTYQSDHIQFIRKFIPAIPMYSWITVQQETIQNNVWVEKGKLKNKIRRHKYQKLAFAHPLVLHSTDVRSVYISRSQTVASIRTILIMTMWPNTFQWFIVTLWYDVCECVRCEIKRDFFITTSLLLNHLKFTALELEFLIVAFFLCFLISTSSVRERFLFCFVVIFTFWFVLWLSINSYVLPSVYLAS